MFTNLQKNKYFLLIPILIVFVVSLIACTDSEKTSKIMDANEHYKLAKTNIESGKYQEAVDAYKQAIRINPDYADAHFNLGLAYFNLYKYEEALDAYKQVIMIEPDYAKAHYNLGVMYIIEGNKESAMEEFKILIELDKELAYKLFDLI